MTAPVDDDPDSAGDSAAPASPNSRGVGRFSLAGAHAVVTGAGGGIGKAIAEFLHDLGAQVTATSRQRGRAAELARRFGGHAATVDVRDVASLDGAVDALWAHRRIDILVNNAGVNQPQPVLDVTVQAWDEVHSTDLRGVFFLSQAVARRMVADRGGGTIINVSSQAGSVAIADRAAYCSAKGGLDQLTRVMALELAPHGVRVNGVAPTFVETEMTRSTLIPTGAWERIVGNIPIGRLARPEDVVGAVGFLAGPLSAMVTGHVLAVDGGWTIH